MAKVLRFLYDYASPYAYLASTLATEVFAGIDVHWEPIYLRGFERFRTGVPFSPAQLVYIGRDVQRIARRHGIPLQIPSDFPINGLYALRGALVARRWGQFARYHTGVFRAAWADNRRISHKDTIIEVAADMGLDRTAFAAALEDPTIKEELRSATDAAIAAGVFGVPTFMVDGEIFFGHDRMDYARAAALAD